MKGKANNEATIVKANSLVQAGYRLSLAEQHVLLAAIAQVRSQEGPTDQETYEVTANALHDLTGATAQRAYQELAEAAHRLFERQVRIEGGPNKDETGPDNKRVTMTRWVQAIDYIPDEGKIEVQFSSRILPYLTLMKEQFTKYEFRNVARMRSTHGIRLYELLCQWRQAGEREIEIDDLKRMFGVEGRYPSIKDLKKYVIEPGVRDVNNFSDLAVEWGQRKRGRRVAAIQFRFSQKKSEKKAVGKKKYTRKDLERKPDLAKPGEGWEDALARLNQQAMNL